MNITLRRAAKTHIRSVFDRSLVILSTFCGGEDTSDGLLADTLSCPSKGARSARLDDILRDTREVHDCSKLI